MIRRPAGNGLGKIDTGGNLAKPLFGIMVIPVKMIGDVQVAVYGLTISIISVIT